MTELSLHSYTGLLSDIADVERIPSEVLKSHISGLENIRKSYIENGLGERAASAARLLVHYEFELSGRLDLTTTASDAAPTAGENVLDSSEVA